jgi:hypothetical protein
MLLEKWLSLVDISACLASAVLLLDEVVDEELGTSDREQFRDAFFTLRALRDRIQKTVSENSAEVRDVSIDQFNVRRAEIRGAMSMISCGGYKSAHERLERLLGQN